jgi:hypothetical protein
VVNNECGCDTDIGEECECDLFQPVVTKASEREKLNKAIEVLKEVKLLMSGGNMMKPLTDDFILMRVSTLLAELGVES